jgi:hypothetical protein
MGGFNLGQIHLSPSDSMYTNQFVAPITITPSNLFMGSSNQGNVNTTTAGDRSGNNLLSSTNKTPKGLLTNKQGGDKPKLLTPIAYSPINKGQPTGTN